MVVLKDIKIGGTGSYTPEKVVTSEELAIKLGSDLDWIYQNLGIVERRIAAPNEYSSDLGCKAAQNAINNAELSVNDIDLIIVATATPDRRAPSTACIIQEKLGISNRCPSLDINAVCSGFLYAMTVGFQLIQAGAHRNVLVVGVDTFSKITDWDRRDCVFFGDGAGAVVLQADPASESFFQVNCTRMALERIALRYTLGIPSLPWMHVLCMKLAHRYSRKQLQRSSLKTV